MGGLSHLKSTVARYGPDCHKRHGGDEELAGLARAGSVSRETHTAATSNVFRGG